MMMIMTTTLIAMKLSTKEKEYQSNCAKSNYISLFFTYLSQKKIQMTQMIDFTETTLFFLFERYKYLILSWTLQIAPYKIHHILTKGVIFPTNEHLHYDFYEMSYTCSMNSIGQILNYGAFFSRKYLKSLSMRRSIAKGET